MCTHRDYSRIFCGKNYGKRPCENEPDVFVTLYQALPKGDKMDYIVQKCVELGISRIVPMLSARCVSRPDAKSIKKNASVGKR